MKSKLKICIFMEHLVHIILHIKITSLPQQPVTHTRSQQLANNDPISPALFFLV